MTKTHAIKMFGSVAALAQAIKITRQAVYQWPEELDQRTADEINGAAIRLNVLAPDEVAAA